MHHGSYFRSVLRVAPWAALQVLNGRAARLVQSAANAPSPFRREQPVWDLGIDGTDQVTVRRE